MQYAFIRLYLTSVRRKSIFFHVLHLFARHISRFVVFADQSARVFLLLLLLLPPKDQKFTVDKTIYLPRARSVLSFAFHHIEISASLQRRISHLCSILRSQNRVTAFSCEITRVECSVTSCNFVKNSAPAGKSTNAENRSSDTRRPFPTSGRFALSIARICRSARSFKILKSRSNSLAADGRRTVESSYLFKK